MSTRKGIFAGDDPLLLVKEWLAEAEASEINDANAIALATVDSNGMPDVRMVLLKEIELHGHGQGAFVFYTNYRSVKGRQIEATGMAAFVMHWKTLRRQIRVRGTVSREDGPKADKYYASRAFESRIGAWASAQSQPLETRGALMRSVATETARLGLKPPRPPFWGGYRITPVEIEFWADGAFRLHDRFRWRKAQDSADSGATGESYWAVQRLSP